MSPYRAEFPVGSLVQIVPSPSLEAFRASWRFHNPLEAAQMAFGGATVRVKEVAFYHGGDVLYMLDGAPGIWHETCLQKA